MAINTRRYIENNLTIKTKTSELVKLRFNRAQEQIYNAIVEQYKQGNGVRVIILKARQIGASTLIGSIIFKQTATKFNVSSAVVAHDIESTARIFTMYKLYYEGLAAGLKPALRSNNARILEFDREDGGGLKSSIRCMTAGTQGAGRSSTLHKLHISEFAFWTGDKISTLNGLLQAVPRTKDSFVAIESTANGHNEFKELWDAAMRGENAFVPIFIPWHTLEEYRLPAIDFERTADEQILAGRYGLNDGQLAWRRWCIANNCAGDTGLFKQEYPSSPDEAFLSTGDCFFDLERVIERMDAVSGLPCKRGHFTYRKSYDRFGAAVITDIEFVENTRGCITIFKPPEAQKKYAYGGDTAGEGSDCYAGQMIDKTTLEQVAELSQQKMSEDEYAEQSVCLAKYYNEALIGLETNFNAYIVKLIDKLGYRKQYISEAPADSRHKRYSDRYGFKTTSASRPVILSELRTIFNENPGVINSHAALSEMRTFVRSDDGRRYEALRGKKDDRIMALAIAYYIRHQQRGTIGTVRML